MFKSSFIFHSLHSHFYNFQGESGSTTEPNRVGVWWQQRGGVGGGGVLVSFQIGRCWGDNIFTSNIDQNKTLLLYNVSVTSLLIFTKVLSERNQVEEAGCIITCVTVPCVFLWNGVGFTCACWLSINAQTDWTSPVHLFASVVFICDNRTICVVFSRRSQVCALHSQLFEGPSGAYSVNVHVV